MKVTKNYLIIIGNGFDLAHGFKTDYNSFLENVILIHYNKTISIKPFYTANTRIENLDAMKSNFQLGYVQFHNMFFKKLIEVYSVQNWCDIEDLYYKELISNNSLEKIKLLNDEFSEIKGLLESYLDSNFNKELLKDKKIDTFDDFFKKLLFDSNSLILNFNYTNTLEIYNITQSTSIVNIHGRVFDEENPIIFGYAANDKESRILINRGNKEWIRNIKKHCYKRTNNLDKLNRFLKETFSKEVIILGHSCALSDKLILEQIFNNVNISKITPFYHKNYENYLTTQYNIDRIMENDINFNKLVNYQDSIEMPQLNHETSKKYCINDKVIDRFKL